MPLIAGDVAAVGMAIFFAAVIAMAVAAFAVHERVLARRVRQSRLAPRSLPTPAVPHAVAAVPEAQGSAARPVRTARRRPATPQRASLAVRLSSAERLWARQRRESSTARSGA